MNDLELAALLGDAPRAPDPAFRFDVFARMAERALRRAARRRAGVTVAMFAGIGLAFPAAQAAGFTLAQAEPWLMVAGVVSLAYVLAVLTIEGPHALLARLRLLLRVRV